jgi:hypothetical protein
LLATAKRSVAVKVSCGIDKILFYVHVGKDSIFRLSSQSFLSHLKVTAYGGDDPSELRQTAAFRFAHARAITNDAWIINLRATL